MAIISFPPMNKKTILFILFIFISILSISIPYIFDGIPPYEIDLLDCICQIAITIPYFIKNFPKKEIVEETLLEFSKKDLIIFCLVLFINLLDMTIYVMYDETLNFIEGLYNRYNIEMFLLILLSIYASNLGYYKHHYIGIVIFTIFSSLVDYFIFTNREDNLNFDWKHITLSTLDWILESIIITYKKYLMDEKKFTPYSVCLCFAFFNLIFIFILFILKIFTPNPICLDGNCLDLFEFDTSVFTNNISLVFSIIISIICILFYFFFYYQILYNYTSSHVLLAYYIPLIASNFESFIDLDAEILEWVIFVLSIVFILIGLLIYLEIIELNFCNLSDNIRRNLEKVGEIGIESKSEENEESNKE